MAVLTLERLLASMGFGSRKDARGLVRMGLVELDGKVLDDPFIEFKERPEFITVNGEEAPTVEKLYVMLYKPTDVECSHNARDHKPVYDSRIRVTLSTRSKARRRDFGKSIA